MGKRSANMASASVTGAGAGAGAGMAGSGSENSMATVGKNSGSRKSVTTPQLSCELCREKKVKCDKLLPCTNCISSGIVCVPIYRLRQPRGRHAQQFRRTSPPQAAASLPTTTVVLAEDLITRICRLEALIDSMGSSPIRVDTVYGSPREKSIEKSKPHAKITPLASSATSHSATMKVPKQGVSIRCPDDFWEDLVKEIHGLRGVIELTHGEVHEDSPQVLDGLSDTGDAGIKILGLSEACTSPSVPRNVIPNWIALSCDQVAVSQLCQVYLRQVDPIIKILHRSSLDKWLLKGEGYLGYPDGHASVEALGWAVCYSAASSISESECRSMFQTEKSCVVTDYRRACEMAIERSGLLTTRDTTVLQAFILYLIARRSEDQSRAVWTLIAVAVRIAKALCLYLSPNKEAGRSETFFSQQMRKRLWLTICLIDVQSSFGQVSEPLIGLDEAAPSLTLPKHINDSDFDPNTLHEVPDREGLTDTTFALVTYHVQLCGRFLNFTTPEEKNSRDSCGSSGVVNISTLSLVSDREIRQTHARNFEQQALRLLHFCDPGSSPFAWFTWHGTQTLVAGARLAALRPLQRSSIRTPPPRTQCDTELLTLTLQALEKVQLMHTDPRGKLFRWYVTVPWHALAIAIAECYVCTNIDLVRRAWPLVEASYQLHESFNVRYSGGIPKSPLAKLMRRTREKLGVPLHSGNNGIANPSFGISENTSLESSMSLSSPNTILKDGLIEPFWGTTIKQSYSTSESIPFNTGPAHTVNVPMSLPHHIWNPNSSSMEPEIVLAPGSPTSGPLPDELMDQSWKIWEEFLLGISPDEFGRHETGVFNEINMGAY